MASSRSKIVVVLLALVGVMGLGVVAIVFGLRAASRHVPGNAVLTLEISGSLPQRAEASPIGGLFGPQPLSLLDVRDALARAAGDRRIKAVRVKVGNISAGLATLQEVRGLLGRVADAGKQTTAYLETAGEFAPGNLEYYLATGCQRIVLNPMGDINLIGLAGRVPFARGMFDKLGIEPEFPGIGDYKSARFFYTNKDMTPAQREMTTWLLESVSAQLAQGIAAGRGMELEHVNELVVRGPYLGEQALAEKLVDALLDWPSFVDEVHGSGSDRLEEVSLRRYLRAGRPDRAGTAIAVVVAEGGIIRGESGYSPVPLFGGDMMGSDTIARAWREVRDSNAKAAVFRINSPGGSAIASELIRNEMMKTAKEIPVVVSMGDVAASGGYWVSCGAQKIVADPGTITASIGVFGGHLAMEKFWEEKLGVTWGRVDFSENASLYDSLDPWTEAQRTTAIRFLDRIYDAFIVRVAESRNMTREQVDAIGRGRVFTGVQAKERGLVDELGGFDDAIAMARGLAGLKDDARISLEFYPRMRPLWQRLLDQGETRVDLRKALQSMSEAKVVPGPVWLPPIQIR